jgi:microcystin-dependent protein
MADPFVAEIRILPFNFAPKGWAFCDGQLMPISQNTALFSLLGTTYGGNGTSNFALPNLQGSVPVQSGQGAGLSFYALGEVTGVEYVTLLQSEMPSHSHAMQAQTIDQGDNRSPAPTLDLAASQVYSDATAADTQLDPAAVSVAGNSQPHNNLMPYLTVNFCIALQGVFPARS